MSHRRCTKTTTPDLNTLGMYRSLGQTCAPSPGVVTVNTKYFPSPVEDPWLASRVHRSRWLHHTVTNPDHGKTGLSTTVGNIHPTTVGVLQHPDTQEYKINSHPLPYNFVAHGKTDGGCRGC